MLFTVFTPTYNRGHLLERLYHSLCSQVFTDFEWLIVDDGSVDETWSIVDRFRQEKRFSIRYVHQENGGKHRAINTGVKKAEGELFFIADSDDCLPPEALLISAQEYETVKNIANVGGIAGMDVNMATGQVIGSGLPCASICCNAIDIRLKHHVTGDLKEIFRTEVLRKYPFPEIRGERFCPEQLVWFRIAQHYRLHYFCKPVYCVEYQEEGLTTGITKARMNSPVATMMTYSEMLEYDIPLIQKIKAAINFFRFRYCLKKKHTKVLLACIKWYWWGMQPVGVLIHVKDLLTISRS